MGNDRQGCKRWLLRRTQKKPNTVTTRLGKINVYLPPKAASTFPNYGMGKPRGEELKPDLKNR